MILRQRIFRSILLRQSYSQCDSECSSGKRVHRKAIKMWECLGEFTLPFLFLSLQVFLLSSSCSFLVSISSLGLCAKFSSRDAAFGTSGCLSFYSVVALCVSHLLTFCSFPRRLQNLKKRERERNKREARGLLF